MENRSRINAAEISSSVIEYFKSQGVPISGDYGLAGKAGSDRKFFRITHGEKSWILMISPANDDDFSRHVAYGKFFRDLNLPTPEIYHVDQGACQVVEEDFGDIRLFDIVVSKEKAMHYYKRAIETLVDFQERSLANAKACPALAGWHFDFDGLTWETSYFLENCIIPEFNPSERILNGLRSQFRILADAVSHHCKTVIHRDFQSQNILLRENSVGLIDFQGARMGSHFYDIASLLWDPYAELDQSIVLELFRYYLKMSGMNIDDEAAGAMLIEASLQRIMQACGAYYFLVNVKKNLQFAKFQKPGLNRLRLILDKIEGHKLLDLKKMLSDLLK